MSTRVLLSRYVFSLPGFPGHSDISRAVDSDIIDSPGHNESPKLIGLEFPEEHIAFINKQELKTMREDVLAASICSHLLLKSLDVDPEEIKNIPLFISSGVVVQKIFAKRPKVLQYFNEALLMKTPEARNKRLTKIIPPMMALETLTNAAESYSAQYGKFAGENTTFGGCSSSGYYALKDGFDRIKNGDADRAVVGAVNLGGIFSYRTFRPFFESLENWHESQCASFLFLESEKSFLTRRGNQAFELIEFDHLPIVPSIFNSAKSNSSLKKLLKESSSQLIFSGPYAEEDFLSYQELFKSRTQKTFSWFPSFGNLGASSVNMNLLAASYCFGRDNNENVDCIDRDPYGRVTRIRIKPYIS